MYSEVAASYRGKDINTARMLANFIRNSKDDSFVFILGKNGGQVDKFNKWIHEHKLEDYIICRPEYGITNQHHLDAPRNLFLVVMASKEHFIHDMLEETENEN